MRNINLPEAIIFPKSHIKKLVKKSILAENGKVSRLFVMIKCCIARVQTNFID